MKYSYLVLINAIGMALLGFFEFQDGREHRLLPLLFLGLGVMTLTMNNTIAAGNRSAAIIVLIATLGSLIATFEPIIYAYERYHMMSVYRYAGIAIINLLTIIGLLNFLFFKGK